MHKAHLRGITLVALLFLWTSDALAAKWRSSRPEDHVELLKTDRAERADKAYDALVAEVSRALLQGDVKRLEDLAISAAPSTEVLNNGLPKLAAFYIALSGEREGYRSAPPEQWDRMLAAADRWQRAFPRSPYAVLGKAALLVAHGWAARGFGYASTVTREGWTTFRESLGAAHKELETKRSLAGMSPEWYAEMVKVSVGLSLGRAQLAALTDEALQKHPEYYPIYIYAVNAFLPEWGGSTEQLVAYVEHIRAAAPRGLGPTLYAQIYYEASCCAYQDGLIFTEAGAQWYKLMQGLEDLRRRYPDPYNVDMEAYFACSAIDSLVLPGLMAEIGNSPHPSIWKDAHFFRACQEMSARMTRKPDDPSEWVPAPSELRGNAPGG
jgi:hypothetical protein